MLAKRLLLILLGAICLFQTTAEAQAFLTAWGTYGSSDGQFKTPVGIAVGGSGDVYVTDLDNNRVQVFSSTGTYLRQWYWPGRFNIAVDANDNVYLVSPSVGVVKSTSAGTYLGQWGSLWDGWDSIALDALDNVYLTGSSAASVQVFTPAGGYLKQWWTVGDDTPTADGLAVDALGNVYVACPDGHRIEKFASDGTFITEWRGGAPDGQFWPIRVAIGPGGHVYVVDAKARVQVFTSEGAFVTMWGSPGTASGQFDTPLGIAVDAHGDIYVADSINNRIQKFGLAPTPVNDVTWGSVKARFRSERGTAQSVSRSR